MHGLFPVLLREIKTRADQTFDPFARVQIFVDRNFVRRAAFELSAHPNVDALGVFSKHSAVYIFCGTILERYKSIVEGNDGTNVGIEIESKSKTEQNVARMLKSRHARIPECAKKDGTDSDGE